MTTFSMTGAALVTRPSVRDAWQVVGSTGDFTVDDIPGRRSVRPSTRTPRWCSSDRCCPADERGLVSAFTSHAASVLTRERLVAEAATAKGLARDNRARTALLAAVSHDLRTPLAIIKAAVSSLRQDDVHFSDEDEAELLETVEESTDRLGTLIGNLLDMSRIQTGTITARVETLSVGEAVHAADTALSEPGRVRLQVDEDADLVLADAGLLDRVLANVLENAVRHSPGRREVLVQADRIGRRVQIRVVDRGPVCGGRQGADLRALPARGRRPAR